MARTEVRSLRITTDTRQAQQSFETLDRQLGRVGQSGEQMARRVRRSGESVGGLARETTNASRGINLLTRSFAGLAGVLAIDQFERFAQSITDIENSAARLGTTVESIQILDRVARSTGLALEDFTEAFITQQELISEAAREGTGGAAEALEELGISAQQLLSLGVEDQFRVLAEAISNVENQSDQARLAIKLWETEGARLLPILKQGADGFDELAENARRSGAVLSGETVRSISQMRGEIALASEQLKSRLLPVVVTVVEGWALMAEQGERAFRRLANSFGLLQTDVQQNTEDLKELTQATIDLRTAQSQLEAAGGFDPTGKATERITQLQTRIRELNQELGRGEFAKLESDANEATDALDQFNASIQNISTQALPSVDRSATQAGSSIARVGSESQVAARAMREAEAASQAAARAYEEQGRAIEGLTGGRSGIIVSILQTRDEIAAEIERSNRPVWERFWEGIGQEGQQAGTTVATQFTTALSQALETGDVGQAFLSAVQASLPTIGAAVGTYFGGPVGGFIGASLGQLGSGLLGNLFGGGGGEDTYPISFYGGFGEFGATAGPDSGPYQEFVRAIRAMDDAISELVGPDGLPEVIDAIEDWDGFNRRMAEGAFDAQSAFEGVRSRFEEIFTVAFPEYLERLEEAADIREVAALLDEIAAKRSAVESFAELFGVWGDNLERAEEWLQEVALEGETYAETLARTTQALQEADNALQALEEAVQGLADFQREIATLLGQTPWEAYTQGLADLNVALEAGNTEQAFASINRAIQALGQLNAEYIRQLEEGYAAQLKALQESFEASAAETKEYYDSQRDAAREWYDDQRRAAEELYETEVEAIEAQLDALQAQRDVAREMERSADLWRGASQAAENLLQSLQFSEQSPLSAQQRFDAVEAEIERTRRERQQAIETGDEAGAAAAQERLVELLRERLELAEEVFQRGSFEYAAIFEETADALRRIQEGSGRRADDLAAAAQEQNEKLDALEAALESELESLRNKLDERFDILDQQLEQRLAVIDYQENRRLRELQKTLDDNVEEINRAREEELERINTTYRNRLIELQQQGVELYHQQIAEQQAIVEQTQKQVGLSIKQNELLAQILATLRATRTTSVSRTAGELRYG